MNSEMTEILIGKFLDSEISPAEQRLLDAELIRNPRARELLKDLRCLRDAAEQTLSQELPEADESAQLIFDRAWQQSKHPRLNQVKLRRRWSVIVALAAGLALGIGIHALLAHFVVAARPSNPAASSPLAEHQAHPGNTLDDRAERPDNTLAAAQGDPTDQGPDLAQVPSEPETPAGLRPGRPPGGPAGYYRVPGGTSRRVDWYTYSDASGRRWLVETYRDDNVKPAAYHGDL